VAVTKKKAAKKAATEKALSGKSKAEAAPALPAPAPLPPSVFQPPGSSNEQPVISFLAVRKQKPTQDAVPSEIVSDLEPQLSGFLQKRMQKQ